MTTPTPNHEPKAVEGTRENLGNQEAKAAEQTPAAATASSTLYLCKMDPEAPGEPKFIGVIGRIVEINAKSFHADGRTEQHTGYQFIPNLSSHKRSRKLWPSANASIPKWTERYGFLRLLEHSELPHAR